MNLAIIQARTSSSRLPGKALLPLMGSNVLSLMIERVLRAKNLDAIVVATSTETSDDLIEAICEARSVRCVRGDLIDVLSRFWDAALRFPESNTLVRLTGDCPLIDPLVIDHVIDFYSQGKFDYATNAVHPTYPDGLDVEVMSRGALERAWREAKLPHQREHVTPFINTQSDLFRIGHYRGPWKLDHLRWTLDHPQDFEFIKAVYEQLYPSKPHFDYLDVLRLIEQKPELLEINAMHVRNEGLRKSVEKDLYEKKQ